ncbi:hypothetical protein BKA93DRAFT_881238 [Sparassis latifolia]|uniref:F-box domain-containing protein n=1 Tax=Sparassis crispa TaxID=139825 RepID=A0A401H6R5_9APHY|nr:hypothetical protein SCP_1800720 [Sparassis crispa]GBE90050.1 hypothetical protein SCP_1800720 [Sparassis crispa]
MSVLQLSQNLLSQTYEEIHGLSADDMSLLERVMAEALLHVRSTMNAARPISRFPNEILGLIFQYASDLPDEKDNVSPDPKSPFLSRKVLWSITHVCQRWRDAAISTSSLWTIICNHDYVPYTTVLQRSKPALLKVHIHKGDPEMSKTILSNTPYPRIQELYLSDTDLDNYCPTNYAHFFALRVLSLVEVRMTAEGARSLLSHGGARCLTVLSLNGVRVDASITLSDLTTFISGCPRLEELMLEDLSLEPPPRNTTLHVPSLQHLRRIAVGEPWEEGAFLASWLIAHADRSGGVAARIYNQDTFPLRSEFSSIYPTSFDGLQTLDVRALHRPECHPALVVTACSALSALRVECSKSHSGWGKTEDGGPFLWRDWPLTHVQELHIRDSEDVREHTGLVSLLPWLVSLTSLVVHAFEAEKPSVLRILATPPDLSLGTWLPCPELATLHVIAEDASVVDDIVALATMRAEHGRPLHTIFLRFPQPAADERALANLIARNACVQSVQVSGLPDVEVKWPALCTGGAEIFWPAL